MEKQWTIVALLQQARQYLASKGVSSPRLDAEILLGHSVRKDRIGLYLNFDCPVTSRELACFRETIRRRAQREPVAYITGTRQFWSMDLHVSPAVLIPRPETELLVEVLTRSLTTPEEQPRQKTALEIGTGSGALSIALASENPNLSIVAVDNSLEALRVARHNCLAHGLSERISLVCSDWLGCVKPGKQFDVIVSNPPYIPSDELQDLEPEIRCHEPRQALDGGADGLDFYRRMADVLPCVLKKHGWAAVELGEGQARQVGELFRSTGVFDTLEIVRDYNRNDRVLVGHRR